MIQFVEPTVTDGGLETDLLFNHGVDLPEFAAYPLLREDRGRALLREYYLPYADIARRYDTALLLESPTWRANADWGTRLGDSQRDLDELNALSISWLRGLREQALGDLDRVRLGGTVGPRGDGYQASGAEPDEAAAYHRPQLAAFAEAGADLATAYTLTGVGEAVGIVRAARQVGLPIGIAFTVETDGRLPDGSTLSTAISSVQAEEPPDHFLINCAHPTHIALALDELPEHLRAQIRGVAGNASTLSHAELDEAEELDDGDPADFGTTNLALSALLPDARIFGGCCGTDVRHVDAVWSALVGSGRVAGFAS